MIVLYWMAVYGDRSFEQRNVKLDKRECQKAANEIIQKIWPKSFVQIQGEPTGKGSSTSAIESFPWGIGVSPSIQMDEDCFFIEMDDRNQRPNDTEHGVPVYLSLRALTYTHIDGYEFNFKRFKARVKTDKPERATIYPNFDYWGGEGRIVSNSRVTVDGGRYVCRIEVKPQNSQDSLEQQYNLFEKPQLTVKSATETMPLPKLDATLCVHVTDMRLLKSPKSIDDHQAKKALAKRLLLKSIELGISRQEISEDGEEIDEIVLARHKAPVNCK